MAVYKATYCYPFLNTFDGRVTATTEMTTPAQYLKCKIETSNKIVTGYSIEIYDEDNNRVFPYSDDYKKISPIAELPQNLGNDINSGYNGTYLNIPFFQNNDVRIKPADSLSGASYNAVYYIPRFKANYLIGSDSEFSGVDNISNWKFDSESQELYCEGFGGVLNEELLVENEVIFIAASDSLNGGMWYVQSSGRLARYTLPGDPATSINIDYFVNNASKVVITNGKYHGRIYEPVINKEVEPKQLIDPYFQTTTAGMWKDCSNNLINLTNEAGNYKWVITLYQSPVVGSWSNTTFVPDYREAAEGILKDVNNINIDLAHLDTEHTHPWYCDYTNMSIDWYDMSLNRGSILGSTKDRIQIADQNETLLPGDNSTETIVLQSRYVQLLDKDEKQIGPRAYITSYDASYGHIYPQSGSFTNDIFDSDSAVYAQVFKYSNDPNAITAHDTVTAATTANITLAKTQTIDGVGLVGGEFVLVKNQTSAKENGIYKVVSDGDWVRSGSYDEWGDFIGKVIYVQYGDTNGGKNFISQARTGGTLYLKDKSPSGESPLSFTEEKPLLLFPSLVNRTATFYAQDMNKGAPFPVSSTTIDGVAAKDGDTCIWVSLRGLYVYRFDSSNINEDLPIYWWEIEKISTQEDCVWQILYGGVYGGRYFLTGTDSQMVTTPCTAKILKNTTTKTYIKPFIGLNTGMALCFANNRKITYSDSTQKGYLLFNSVNKKLWSVAHAELASPLQSWGDTSESNVVPYSYDVKTFYKTSDENPFSLYDAPYLKLGTGNGGYTDVQTYEPFWVKYSELDDTASKYFCVLLNNSGDSRIPFYVKKPTVTALTSRYITLQGNYYQWQQASWESYRWILTDINGNVLQDTGKKYDRSMEVTFYGLTNEAAKYKNQYYAILLVEDSLGQSLSFSLHIVVDPNSIETINIPFYAEYDCNTHAVSLSYQTTSFVKPSIIVQEGDSEVLAYVASNKLLSDTWDRSLIYSEVPKWGDYTDNLLERVETDWMNITGEQESVSNEIFNWLEQQNDLSNTELLGVKYQYYFEKRAQTQDVTSHFLSTIEQIGNENGEFSLQTKVKLPDNFCSNIIETAIDLGDKNHQLHVQLSIPLKFESLSSDTLNENRNKIAYNIFIDSNLNEATSTTGYLKASDTTDFKWRESVTSGSSYYFLQNSLINDTFWKEGQNASFSPSSNHEYLHYNSFSHDSDPGNVYYPFFINLKDKNVVNSTKFLGNLGLVSNDDLKLATAWNSSYQLSTNDSGTSLRWDTNCNFFLKQAPCYWSENHYEFKLYQRDGYIVYPMNMSYNGDILSYHNESDTPLKWPSDEDERKFYWEEYGDESDSNVNLWRATAPRRWSTIFNKAGTGEWDTTEADANNSGWKVLDFFNRNYTWLNDYTFLITIRIKDVDTLGNSLGQLTTTGSENDKEYTTTFSVGDKEVGSISIIKIQDSDNTRVASY